MCIRDSNRALDPVDRDDIIEVNRALDPVDRDLGDLRSTLDSQLQRNRQLKVEQTIYFTSSVTH